MPSSALVLLLLGLATIGFLVSRGRAAHFQADHRTVHSRPNYHGWYSFIWVFLPAALLIFLGVAAGGAAAYGMIAVAVIILVIAAVVGNTLSQVFRVALYRFVTGNGEAPGFSTEDLEHAFRPKKRRNAVA